MVGSTKKVSKEEKIQQYEKQLIEIEKHSLEDYKSENIRDHTARRSLYFSKLLGSIVLVASVYRDRLQIILFVEALGADRIVEAALCHCKEIVRCMLSVGFFEQFYPFSKEKAIEVYAIGRRDAAANSGGVSSRVFTPLTPKTHDSSRGATTAASTQGRVTTEQARQMTTHLMSREAHWGRCELLTVSSTFFLAPLIFADCERWLPVLLAVLSILTSANSVRLWADPQNFDKWQIDRLTARSSAFIYTCVGIALMPREYLLKFGVPTWLAMGVSYITSRYLDGRRDQNWIFAHIAFHACVAAGMCEVMSNT